MFDWIKFFPFAAKDDHKPSEVRGPYFSTPKPVKWHLGDNVLRFKAPRSNPIFSISRRGSSFDAISPENRDILTGTWQSTSSGNADAPESDWQCQVFYSDTWYFVGPWFTGEQARLKASAILISAREGSTFLGESVFHPKVFESAIASALDDDYGYKKNNTGKKPNYRGPLNWRVLHISTSIQAVVCDIHFIGNTGKDNPQLIREVYLPITARQFVCISIDFGGTAVHQNEVCSKPLFELCDSIINSICLEVGEQTQAEWDKVKATCPDMSITETFGELPWPLTKEKPSKKRKEMDITPKPGRVERLHSG